MLMDPPKPKCMWRSWLWSLMREYCWQTTSHPSITQCWNVSKWLSIMHTIPINMMTGIHGTCSASERAALFVAFGEAPTLLYRTSMKTLQCRIMPYTPHLMTTNVLLKQNVICTWHLG